MCMCSRAAAAPSPSRAVLTPPPSAVGVLQERHALRLYERHGFKQVEEGDRLGFVNWLMHRPGRQQAGAG